jgi:hypothetical protein
MSPPRFSEPPEINVRAPPAEPPKPALTLIEPDTDLLSPERMSTVPELDRDDPLPRLIEPEDTPVDDVLTSTLSEPKTDTSPPEDEPDEI